MHGINERQYDEIMRLGPDMTSQAAGAGSPGAERHLKTLEHVKESACALRQRGARICLTSGSFDLLHDGHLMYLNRARSFGDFLLVGVDSDAKVRERKGSGRPFIPQAARIKMLMCQPAVGAVFLKSARHAPWALIKYAHPDVLVVTEGRYPQAAIGALRVQFRCEVRVLKRMSSTSTTARLTELHDSQKRATEGVHDQFLI